jgi:hypothetical protein
MPIEGVLFDWRGTLVRDPDDLWWVRTALTRSGRYMGDASVVTEIVDRLRRAHDLLKVVEAQA